MIIFKTFQSLENFYIKFRNFPNFSRICTNPGVKPARHWAMQTLAGRHRLHSLASRPITFSPETFTARLNIQELLRNANLGLFSRPVHWALIRWCQYNRETQGQCTAKPTATQLQTIIALGPVPSDNELAGWPMGGCPQP